MSLAEYTKRQKLDSKVYLNNIKRFVENNFDILQPEQIAERDQAKIQGSIKFDVNDGTTPIDELKKRFEELLKFSKIELKQKLNNLDDNDNLITEYILRGLDDGHIIFLNSVFDAFITELFSRHKIVQKEVFLAEAKNYLEHKYSKAIEQLHAAPTTEQFDLLENYIDNQNELKQFENQLKKESENKLQEKEAKTIEELEKITQLHENEQNEIKKKEEEEKQKALREEMEKQKQERIKLIDEQINKNITVFYTAQDKYRVIIDQIDEQFSFLKSKFQSIEDKIENFSVDDNRTEVAELLRVIKYGTNAEYIGSFFTKTFFGETVGAKMQNLKDLILIKLKTETIVDLINYINSNPSFFKNKQEKAPRKLFEGTDIFLKIKGDLDSGFSIIDNNELVQNKQELSKTLGDIDELKQQIDSAQNSFQKTLKNLDILNDTANKLESGQGDKYKKIIATKTLLRLVDTSYEEDSANLINKGNRIFQDIDDFVRENANKISSAVVPQSTAEAVPSETTKAESTIKTSGKGMKSRFKLSNAQKLKQDSRYYIDKKLLGKNILSVKYASNGNIHPKFKQVFISDNLKSVLKDYIDDDKVEDENMKKLQKEEKRLLSNIMELTGDEKATKYKDNEFDEEFKILLGEIRAGNDNPDLKKQLKKYILVALQEGKLSKSVAFDLMLELN